MKYNYVLFSKANVTKVDNKKLAHTATNGNKNQHQYLIGVHQVIS